MSRFSEFAQLVSSRAHTQTRVPNHVAALICPSFAAASKALYGMMERWEIFGFLLKFGEWLFLKPILGGSCAS